jgi:hypothetical protein
VAAAAAEAEEEEAAAAEEEEEEAAEAAAHRRWFDCNFAALRGEETQERRRGAGVRGEGWKRTGLR